MSGMYNMIFGIHPLATGLVDLVLGIDVKTVPRFRDCYPVQYDEEDRKIELVTRAGYNHEEEVEALEKHPLYLDSKTGEPDDTYRIFWFAFPEENEHLDRLYPLLEKHPEAVFTKPLGVRWQEAVDALEPPKEDDTKKIILTGTGESS